MEEELLMKDFALISGLAPESVEEWRPFVLACWAELRGKLRAGVDEAANKERLALACAALANHRYQTIVETSCGKVQVGEISFTQNSGEKSRKELLEMVGDLLDSQGVCVKGVEVW